MLSRAAESVYWMNRYIERAENIARFIRVNVLLNLDVSGPSSHQWGPLIKVTGDYDLFTELKGEPSQENVIDFLTFEARYPNSIMNCLRHARENARSVRSIISSAMWQQLNTFYLMVRGVHKGLALEMPDDFFNRIQLSSHSYTGVMSATMTHGEAWHFARMGTLMERADKTSRILDVKYFILLPGGEGVGTPFDTIQWAALLKSASAFEMYRKRFGSISPTNVADFLIFDREFPRSIHYCLAKAEQSLHAITGSPDDTYRIDAERSLGKLLANLAYSDISQIIAHGLHEFLDDFQLRLNEVDDAVTANFFTLESEIGTGV